MAKTHFIDAAPDGTERRHTRAALIAAALLSCTAFTAPARAADKPAPDAPAPAPAPDAAAPDEDKDIIVTGALNALPVKGVGSVFGFNKTLVETPRSASTISKEQIERFGVTDIYDLVAQVPGTFTNSFFGVGGSLDIRGTPGEVYFRGVRRLDNAGNYPTPIGSADRIDIVRGPASPIYGPSKTGGYMNFVPKSARVAGGALQDHATGEISYTGGSWGKNNVKAEVRGPADILGTTFGYSIYGELEDSGSYYRNMETHQVLLQGSFDNQISEKVRIEFGGQYQKFDGQQNGGWNRLTQDLVDNGTYITGQPRSLDTDGDGQYSQAEAKAANGGKGLAVFGAFACGGGTGPAGFTDACLKANYPDLALINPGTTKLSRRDVLTGPDDQLRNRQYTGYFDVIFDDSPDFQLKNQLFFDNTRNVNNNAYGFSQFVKSWVLEDKIVADKTFHTDIGKFEIQLSPSVRYTKFHYGDDFDVEEFHRVDLSVGYTPASDRLLSNESGDDYADYLRGHYTDLGAAALVDLDFNFGLDVIGGLRYDHVDVTSSYDPSRMDRTPSVINGSDSQGGWSWNGSVSYKLPFGLHPYGTIARQTTIVVGQGAEIAPDALISTGGSGFLAASRLYEGGIKGSWLNEKLYAAVSVYQQTRTDHNVQSSTVNQSVETDGLEAELRWSVDRHLLLSGAYTRTKVYNLTFQDAGSAFSFFGIEDLVNVKDGSLFQGGQVEGLIPITSKEGSRRAGIPENLESATATYAFDNGLAFSGSVSHVQSVYSGQSMVVKLPAYTLVDLGVSYTKGPFLFRVVVKNATDATYYRANFTELFGSTIVLPEKPRSFQATASFRF